MCGLTAVLTQGHSLDMLKAYHLERETWKKGSVLAVLWARKLKAVAVTILLHHPLRPRASALCLHWAWEQVAGDSSELVQKRL